MNKTPPSSNLISQFQRLSNHFENKPEIHTTIDQVADALCCTRRNVNNVLEKMSSQGWLSWQPARGRGKLSQLNLHVDAKQPVLKMAQSMAVQGQLEEAFELLPYAADKNKLFNFLKTQLGFQSETPGNQLLRIPYHRALPDLDPVQATRITEIHMINQIMDTLVRYDRDTRNIRPHLAHSWRVNDQGTEWTFYLRPGIKFHHDRLLDAEDVAATLEHLINTESPYQRLYQHISKITCHTPLMFTIYLTREDYLLLQLLANHCSSIQPEDRMHETDFTRHPIGTGPFSIRQNNEFQLELVANHEYFRERALLDRIEIWFFKDEKIPLEQYSDVVISDTSQTHNDPNMHFNSNVEKGYQYLLFNVAKPNSPLHELRIRRSIRSMLDPHKMIQQLGGTRATPARRLLPDWEAIPQRLMFPVRPRMPMQLQQPLILKTYDIHMEDALWIKQSLAEFSIPVEVVELAYADFTKPGSLDDADLVVSGEALDDNLEMALYEWFATQRSLRHCMGDEIRFELDDMIRQAVGMREQEERMEAFRQMDIYLQQKLVLMPLYHHQQMLHYGDRVQGLNLNSLGWVDFKDIWFT